MTEILIKRTCKGSEGGFCVLQFQEGEVYEVSRSLAAELIGNGWAMITKNQVRKNWEELKDEELVSVRNWTIGLIRKRLSDDPEMLREFTIFLEENGYE